MSFENTKNNLANLENGGPISGEVMFNLIGIVIKDVQAINSDFEVPEMDADEQRGFALAVRNVLKKTLQMLQGNQDSFRQLSARSQEECQELVVKICEQEHKLDDYAQIESEREKLKKQFEELETKNRKLLEVAEECKGLQARIEEFGDNTLEVREEERDRLQIELREREKRAEKLQAEIDKVREAIVAVQSDSQAKTSEKERLDSQLKTLNQELEALGAAVKKNSEERTRIEKVISETKAANSTLLEQQSEYSELFVAFNSILSDPFVKEYVFKLDDSAEVFSIAESPDIKEIGMRINSASDLQSWISKVQTRIELLMNVYQAELQMITERSETFALLRSST